jgi:hypothetical protein
MKLSLRTRSIAAAAAAIAVSLGALGAPSGASAPAEKHAAARTAEHPGASLAPGGHGTGATTRGALPPQLDGYQLAGTSTTSWGEWEQDLLPPCLGVQSPYGGHTRVGQYFENGRTPRVGEIFFAQLDFGWTGSSCMPHTEILTEWVTPVGTEPWTDDTHAVAWSVYSADTAEPQWHTNVWVSQGPHGGPVLQSTNEDLSAPEPWSLRQGQALTLVVPVKVMRPLVGAGSRAPSCQERRTGLGPCPAAQSGDYLQVGVQATHRGGGWYAPNVGLFATGSGSSPSSPSASKLTPTLAVSAVKVSSRRKGSMRVTVRARGQRPTGALVVRLGNRVVGRTTLTAADSGTARVSLKRLPRGKRTLSVSYGGNSRLNPARAARTVRVR